MPCRVNACLIACSGVVYKGRYEGFSLSVGYGKGAPRASRYYPTRVIKVSGCLDFIELRYALVHETVASAALSFDGSVD